MFDYPNPLVRVDTGVEEGAEISPHYDPMIAKLIVHGDTREEAIADLRYALDEGECGPLITNAGFLYRLLGDEQFAAGTVDTGLIGRKLEELTARPEPSVEGLELAAAMLIGGGQGPWASSAGLRLNALSKRQMRLADQFGRDFTVELGEPVDGQAKRQIILNEGGERFILKPWRAVGGADGGVGSGSILAPMPGRVIAVEVAAGDTVTKGEKLLTLEAMKMEHTLTAPFDGVVQEVNCASGDQVQVEALLVRLEASE